MDVFGNDYWKWKTKTQGAGFECFTLVVKKDGDGGQGGRWGPREDVFIAGSKAVAKKAMQFFGGLLLSNGNVVSEAEGGGTDQVSLRHCVHDLNHFYRKNV